MAGTEEETAPASWLMSGIIRVASCSPARRHWAGQKRGTQPRLLGIIERAVEDELGTAGQPHLGHKVIEAIVHRQGGGGEDPGHLGAKDLGAKALSATESGVRLRVKCRREQSYQWEKPVWLMASTSPSRVRSSLMRSKQWSSCSPRPSASFSTS